MMQVLNNLRYRPGLSDRLMSRSIAPEAATSTRAEVGDFLFRLLLAPFRFTCGIERYAEFWIIFDPLCRWNIVHYIITR
jgi:hypothetical protein